MANDCWLLPSTAALASSSSQWPALQMAIGHGGLAFDSRGGRLCQAAGFTYSLKRMANGSQWPSGFLLEGGGGSWGNSPAPPAARGGSSSGRCVSAHTREHSEQPLPLHPAIRLRRMCWVAAASGPAWQSYWLLLLLLLLLPLPLAIRFSE
jgi:hypothetical protein